MGDSDTVAPPILLRAQTANMLSMTEIKRCTNTGRPRGAVTENALGPRQSAPSEKAVWRGQFSCLT